MFLFAVLKINGSKIALKIWSLSSVGGVLIRYIFVLFSSLDQAEKFKKYYSSKHPNINFLLEKENEKKGKFVTNVYRKKTFFVVYTNFDSFIPETYKTGLVVTVVPMFQFMLYILWNSIKE